jgi:hypothetical protein
VSRSAQGAFDLGGPPIKVLLGAPPDKHARLENTLFFGRAARPSKPTSLCS